MTYPIGLRLAGAGVYAPRTRRPSSALDALYGKAEGWTQARFGIAERGIAQRDETTSFMAAQACRAALNEAGWSEDFDVLVGACGVMEQPIPGTSVLVQHALGLHKSGIPCFDVNMTCLSFLSALDLVSLGIKAGRWRRALIFASDIASAGLDISQPEMSAIFGDGAAAVCVEAGPDDGPAILSCRFLTLSSGKDMAHLRSGGTGIRIEDGYEALQAGARFHMDAFGIFKAAGKRLPELINEAVASAGLTLDDIDTVIGHQASKPGLEYVRHILGTRPERIVDIFGHTGNQIAASLPTVLVTARNQRRLTPGSHALLLGTSAGVSMGAMVIRC
ncbi:3-Oxoacyl-acyl-carrier-protein ACP synthase III protein [Asticcacaulis biprosthecium C19]|uniref:3-Oxoacyl-acyl-carrier-protein ACP synthase III protein n=1 Tax=Asticcacaulis biprosthecium C19 TaxID=715226 RepID=F4QI65_9CAUL|nr:3-oxoacyl-[acyl-carrier-protein] synthase III C-terminal domain-containing protein [Asticcacaulis biprosthecium]EGF91703.1 3-Oxoacyl-acyl-carrier-protein ACP synthase III protein [Asticcacaulis biprosthecium C19]